jgi:AraC family cel operon transcriptional repressor
MIERKRWRRLVASDAWYHLARFRFLPGRPARLHTHDFPEIFWIEAGRGRHTINGKEKRLDPGDLVFVRPADRHVLAAVDAAGFLLVNLALDPRVLAGLLARHRADLAPLHDLRPPLPVRVRLSSAQVEALGREVAVLERTARRRLALERFLLGLYGTALARSAEAADAAAPPDWLAKALERVREPAWFSQGATGLVRAAGRSPEHVARTVRARLGCTPSDCVNRARMDYAARELRLGSRSIVEIALECGIRDLSHFYALFRAAFGKTPRRYRLEQQLLP